MLQKKLQKKSGEIGQAIFCNEDLQTVTWPTEDLDGGEDRRVGKKVAENFKAPVKHSENRQKNSKCNSTIWIWGAASSRRVRY